MDLVDDDMGDAGECGRGLQVAENDARRAEEQARARGALRFQPDAVADRVADALGALGSNALCNGDRSQSTRLRADNAAAATHPGLDSLVENKLGQLRALPTAGAAAHHNDLPLEHHAHDLLAHEHRG